MPVLGVTVPEVKCKVADLDRAACLPSAVHPLWLNTVVLEIKHGVDVLPCFLCNPHYIEKRPVVTVVDLAFHHVLQKEITVSRAAKPYIRHKILLSQTSPNLVVISLYSSVLRGNLLTNGTRELPTFKSPCPAPTDIRDIAHLQIGDIKELGKLDTVCGCLVEHDDKLAVGKHRPRRVALQEVVHILGDTRTVRPVLSHTLPEGKEEVGGILMLKKVFLPFALFWVMRFKMLSSTTSIPMGCNCLPKSRMS